MPPDAECVSPGFGLSYRSANLIVSTEDPREITYGDVGKGAGRAMLAVSPVSEPRGSEESPLPGDSSLIDTIELCDVSSMVFTSQYSAITWRTQAPESG